MLLLRSDVALARAAPTLAAVDGGRPAETGELACARRPGGTRKPAPSTSAEPVPSLSRGSRRPEVRTGRRWHGRKAAAIVAPAVLLAITLSGAARSAEECGPAEAGQSLTCSPATYDPSSDGNIFYGPNDAFEEDFETRLTGDLLVRYNRNTPGDDVLIRRLGAPDSSAEVRSRYGAVVIAPGGPDYSADISVSSAADIATNGRGILIYHEGASCAMRLDEQGGRIVTTESRTGYAVVASHTGSGNVVTAVEGAVIEADGENAIGVIAEHYGAGDIAAAAEDVRRPFHRHAEPRLRVLGQQGARLPHRLASDLGDPWRPRLRGQSLRDPARGRERQRRRTRRDAALALPLVRAVARPS